MLLSLGKVKAKLIEQVSNDKFQAIVEYCEYIYNQADDSNHTNDSNLMDDSNYTDNPKHANGVDFDRLQRALIKDMIIEEGEIDELIELSWPSIIRRPENRRKRKRKRKQKDIDSVNSVKKRLRNP